MLYNYILTFRTYCASQWSVVCAIAHRHIPENSTDFPALLAHSPYHRDCDFRCLQSHGTRNSAWDFLRHLGSTTQPMCVWSASCHEVLAYLNAVRAEAHTLACPRPVEARIFVFTHSCCIFCNTTLQVRVYYPGAEFIVISENIFPETLCLLCTEC